MSKAAPQRSRKTAPDPHAQREAILRAAFEEIAEHGWTAVTMSDIARRADIDLAAVYTVFPAKSDLLDGLSLHADLKVLAADHGGMAEESARDRLFDILMQRFDALEPFKPGFRRLRSDLPNDPCLLLAAGPSLAHSMARMLEAADIPAVGFRGLARIAGLSVVWISTARTWINDDSADLAQTMAALDKALGRAEEIARSVDRTTGRAEKTAKANGAAH